MKKQEEITVENAVVGLEFETDDGYVAEITGIDTAVNSVEFEEVGGERSGNLYVNAECRHSEVEIEECHGGDEYRESPGEFTPDIKFAICKSCGEIV